MGLKITTPLHTDKGDTTEMYLNIESLNINKTNLNNVFVNRYLNKAIRDANFNDKCNCFEINNQYILDFNVTDLETTYIYELVYNKIKTELEGKGFTVEMI